MPFRPLLALNLIYSTLLLQAACNPFTSLNPAPPEVKGILKKIKMPESGYRMIFYKKSNPNIIFLSEKDDSGPGLMIDLATDKEEYLKSTNYWADPDSHPRLKGESDENYYKRIFWAQRPGETRAEWDKRVPSPQPIADRESFSMAAHMDHLSNNDISQGYTLRFQGDYTTEYGLATKGDILPTGVRTTKNLRFTGDLEIDVRGAVVVKQHLENIYQDDFYYRADEALEVGLLFYRDAMRNKGGTLYILKVPRVAASNPEPEGQGVVGHPTPNPNKKKSTPSPSKEPK